MWTSRFFEALGHEVLVANARKLPAIYTSTRKSDQSERWKIPMPRVIEKPWPRTA